MGREYDRDPVYIELRRAFAAKLKRICAAQGWTKARLARELGVSDKTVYGLVHEEHMAWPSTTLKIQALERRLEGERA